MMQHASLHSIMLTFVLLSIDRYRAIAYPMKPRLPAGLCTLAAWILSICAVLPFVFYMKFIPQDNTDFGICLINPVYD